MGTSDSTCLHNYVADYFGIGVVPAGEVTCIPDCDPWDIDCDTFGSNLCLIITMAMVEAL